LVDNPTFFSGFLVRPDIAAAGLLAVADVAASRYADVGRGARLANLDPVVTASGDRLRFESFSECNGVYARLDLLPDGMGSGDVGFGTTNVDINRPLRTALARVHRSEALHLSVGADELRASSLSGTHVERKVRLPERWVRGLGEMPAKSRALIPVAEVKGPAIARLVGSLPRGGPPGPTLYLLPVSGSMRPSPRPLPGSVEIAGSGRLRGTDRIARHASALTVHAGPEGTTAWVFELPGARFTLVLSPDPFRGFSGEGTLLLLLTDGQAEEHGSTLLPHMSWDPAIDPTALAHRSGLSLEAVEAGLAWVAASGRLGYDVSDQAYFHRELPIEGDKILRRHPRLVAARSLLDSGAVQQVSGGWTVTGSYGGKYQISDQDPLRCTCRWDAEHGVSRGPCKHILAVVIGFKA